MSSSALNERREWLPAGRQFCSRDFVAVDRDLRRYLRHSVSVSGGFVYSVGAARPEFIKDVRIQSGNQLSDGHFSCQPCCAVQALGRQIPHWGEYNRDVFRIIDDSVIVAKAIVAIKKEGRGSMSSSRADQATAVFLVLLSAGVLISVFYLGFSWQESIAVGGFVGFLVVTGLQYSARSGTLVAAYTATKYLLFAALVIYFLGVAWEFRLLPDVEGMHEKPETVEMVKRWKERIYYGFGFCFVVMVAAGSYARWRLVSTRHADSRFARLSRLLSDVEQLVLDDSKNEKARREEIVRLCASRLLTILELNHWHSLLSKVRPLFPSLLATTSYFLVHERGESSMSFAHIEMPKKLPADCRKAFKWLEDNHKPSNLDEAGFRGLIELAKGEDPRDWRKRYLNFKDRHKVISAAGWASSKQEMLHATDARECLAFETDYFRKLKEHFEDGILSWVRVRSFIACPVPRRGKNHSDVLFVTSNVVGALKSEDQEAVGAVATLLSSALLRLETKDQ